MDESVKESIKKTLENIAEYTKETNEEICNYDTKLGTIITTTGFFAMPVYYVRDRADTVNFGSFVVKENAEYVINLQHRSKMLVEYNTYLSSIITQLLHELDIKQTETPPPTQRPERTEEQLPKCNVCGMVGRLVENNRRNVYCGYCGSYYR